MRKLLTLLLTLVMAVCLINFNNSHTQADESNDGATGGILFKNDSDNVFDSTNTQITNPNSVGVYDYSKTGATIKLDITNSTNNYAGLNISDADSSMPFTLNVNPNGNSLNITGGTSSGAAALESGTNRNLVINGNGKKLNLLSQSDESAISCDIATLNNINILATANHNNGDSATGNFNSLTLDQKSTLEAVENGTDGRAIFIADSLDIKNGCVLEAQNTNPNNTYGAIWMNAGTSFTYPTDTYEIKGTADGSKTGLSDVVRSGKKFLMKNDTSKQAKYVIIRPKAVPATPEAGDMSYDATKTVGDTPGTFVGTVKRGNDVPALHVQNISASDTSTEVFKKKEDGQWETTKLGTTLYDIVTSKVSDVDHTKLKLKKDYVDGLSVGKHYFKVNLSDSSTNKEGTFYVELTVTDDTPPSPSPSKKDESCEKVIGPTWHWNNDKGICEDYGVVGTSTR